MKILTSPIGIRRLLLSFRGIKQRICARLRRRYTQELENEIARLREENRALVNSILGLAGIPPMRMSSRTDVRLPAGATLGSPRRGKPRPCDSKETQSVPFAAMPPLRRRSWQQLGRAREIEDARAARSERETDTETFPPPRNIVPHL